MFLCYSQDFLNVSTLCIRGQNPVRAICEHDDSVGSKIYNRNGFAILAVDVARFVIAGKGEKIKAL
jgi:hypothetical protein